MAGVTLAKAWFTKGMVFLGTLKIASESVL